MAIIGLCGKPQSGKTEVRKMLEGRFGFAPVCSKTILYEISAKVTSLPISDFFLTERKNETYKGQTHRQITGKLGNAIEEMFGDSFLVNRALQAPLLLKDKYNFVLDSLRKGQTKDFPGLVVEVVSPRSIDTGNSFDEYDRSKIACKIVNDGDLEELAWQVELLLTRLGIS